MTRRVRIAGFIVGAGLLGAAAFVGVRGWKQREQIAAAVPAPPASTLPGDFAARVKAATNRARHGPDRFDALVELSQLYHANGFFPEASRCYQALVQLEPANPRWPHRYASLLATYGELEAAVALWRRTVELAPDYAPAGVRLGDALLKRGETAAAASAYEAVLKRQPTEPYAQLGLARLDVAAQRWPAARDRLERVVAQTDSKLGYDLLPTVYEQLGDAPRAAALRAKQKASGAFSDVPDPWLDALTDDCFDAHRLAVAGGNAAKIGDSATALRLLDRAVELAPNNEYFQYQLGFLHLQLRDYAKAGQHFERSVALAPAFADGWVYLANLRTILGDPAGAERLLATGLQRAPQSPALHLARARQLAAAKRYPEAIAAYRETIRLRPTEAEAFVDLAGVYFAQENLEAGAAALRAALEAEPDFPAALTALAFLAINLGDELGARQWLTRAQQQPRVPPAELAALAQQFQQRFQRRL